MMMLPKEKNEEIADSWVRKFLEPNILRPIGKFLIRHYNPGNLDQFPILEKGAFNNSLRIKYEDAGSAVIRFPHPGATIFQKRKFATRLLLYDLSTRRPRS